MGNVSLVIDAWSNLDIRFAAEKLLPMNTFVESSSITLSVKTPKS
jgi:hypothetical protein